ncbi:MAG: polysaccharide pyruvyl transferase family protein, partial [Sulfurimicrobium sp.]|nr:polysaccharide pyruvyl transferase family protein [Sulfurimicrobium sp.]
NDLLIGGVGADTLNGGADCYQRTASRMQSPAVKIFTSLNLWAICALIAHSRAYSGSSLHGRIVAMAFALPRVNLRHPSETSPQTKQEAYATTWEEPGMPISVEVPCIDQGIREAMAADPAALRQKARALASRYRMEFEIIRAKLK